MLWTMLNLMCFLLPLVAAVAIANQSHTGVGGYALSIGLGLILGAGSAWAMWGVGERVGSAVRGYPEPKRETYFRALYVSAIAWLIVVTIVSSVLVSATIRLLL